jgi:hypothetical protein
MDDQTVTFRWKDYAHGNKPKTMRLDGSEFLRRFLLHVVPRGFMRIRHFGLLANRNRNANIQRCRELLGFDKADTQANAGDVESAHDVGGQSAHDRCPVCREGHMIVGSIVPPQRVLAFVVRLDAS